MTASFAADLWRYPGDAGWYFVSLPLDVATDIRETVEPRGFGSVRVTATVGATTWSTSVFPDASSGSYVLPVKAAVRRAESLDEGAVVTVHLVVHA